MDPNKLTKFSLKSFIKGNTPRLQSLRLPRDLTLGETKAPPKKVYKPNVNAVRNKNRIEKSKVPEKSKLLNIKDKQEKLKERFVQSSGVFSQGIGPKVMTHTKTDKAPSLGELKPSTKRSIIDYGKDSIHKPPRTIDESIQKDPTTDISDSDSDEKLPFVPSSWDKISHLLDIKSETKDFLNTLPSEFSCENDRIYPELTLWQLPDSFACKAKQIGKNDLHLTDLPQGQIGKILVHKSGRYEIKIGNTKYVLDSTFNTFTEDLVYLNTETKSCFVLGKLKNRFVLSPDWGILL